MIPNQIDLNRNNLETPKQNSGGAKDPDTDLKGTKHTNREQTCAGKGHRERNGDRAGKGQHRHRSETRWCGGLSILIAPPPLVYMVKEGFGFEGGSRSDIS